MTKAAKSVYYFGFYLLVVGFGLVAFPNDILALMFFEPTSEVWIRVVGVLALNIGLYYIIAGPTGTNRFILTTVYTRVTVLIWFVVFVLLEWVQPMLIAFGLVDFMGAMWTYMELKKERA